MPFKWELNAVFARTATHDFHGAQPFSSSYQRPGMKRCIGSQEITIFFIGPSYGELYCGSFGVLQSKF